jgi:PAS domain S-box-containing protein
MSTPSRSPLTNALLAGRLRLATLLCFLGLAVVLEAGGIPSPDGAVRVLAAWSLVAVAGLAAYSFIRDVAARREAETGREHSLSVLQAAFESTTDGILVVDDARQIVSHNSRFALLWGLQDRSLVAQPDGGALEAIQHHLDDPAGFVRRVEEIHAEPSAESIDVLHLRDGRVVERYSRPQRVSGEPAGRVWCFRDVTAQVRVEASLRDSEQRYRMVLEQSTDGIVIFDEDGVIVTVNPALAHMLGWTPDELVGRSIDVTVQPGELEEAPVRYDLLRSGESLRRVRRFRQRDDSALTAEVVSKMLPTGHFLALVRDITERELLESQLRQAQKMEAVGQLAGGVAHDFNNLLTVITANADLALEALSDDSAARGDIEEIRRATVRAASLTRQLLAFSRRQPMRTSVVDPVQLLGDLGRLLERLITPSIDLRLDVPARLWRLQADAGQLEQTIVNLAVNARDAMPGGGTLSIRARDETLDAPLPHEHGAVPAGEYLCLEVRDTGIGMTPDVLGRIFEPFFTTKAPGKGTGLGLSTVYGIVKQHGGHILVHTRVGHGTRFRLYLPRTTEEPVPEEASCGTLALDERPDATVLLVDDEHAVLQAVRRTLERRGYTVMWARSPEEALAAESAHQGAIDALVTDVVMPRMSGRLLAESISARRPGIGVLYITGHTTDGELRRDVLGPNRQLLYKPFTTESLLSAVRAVSRGAARSVAV